MMGAMTALAVSSLVLGPQLQKRPECLELLRVCGRWQVTRTLRYAAMAFCGVDRLLEATAVAKMHSRAV